MTVRSHANPPRTRWTPRSFVRLGFAVWAPFAFLWMANSMRTRGVPAALLATTEAVTVTDNTTSLAFAPTADSSTTALLFICGSGVTAEAYAPMLRPIADIGFPVYIIKLPYRFAPLPSHKRGAVERARAVIAAHPEVQHWVVSGHSLGGVLSAQMAHETPERFSALALIGTTHPRDFDLSTLRIPVTKIYGSEDGVAPREKVLANRALLPTQTSMLEIQGANHSQFGRYGRQLMDGKATIGREEQEAITRAAILDLLNTVNGLN